MNNKFIKNNKINVFYFIENINSKNKASSFHQFQSYFLGFSNIILMNLRECKV